MEIKTLHCHSTDLKEGLLERMCFEYLEKLKKEDEDVTIIDSSKAIHIARKYINVDLENIVSYYENIPVDCNDSEIFIYVLVKSLLSTLFCVYLPKTKKLNYEFGVYSHLKYFTNLENDTLKFDKVIYILDNTMKDLEKEINDKYQEEN